MQITTFKNKIFYIRRYLRLFLKHLSFKKLINIFIIELELLMRKEKLKGYPYLIAIDPGNICNLSCPLCPTGKGDKSRPKEIMLFETYKEIIDGIGDFALQVVLHNWGEPLLVPDIFRMIEYTHKKRIETKLSSNLMLLTQEKAECLIRSGLEYLTVSIDGASKESYEKYRLGADFNLVISNLKMLMAMKKKLKRRNPVVEWQFLLMRHNEHEMSKCEKLAGEIGVDVVLFASLLLDSRVFTGEYDRKLAKEWLPVENIKYRHRYDAPYLNGGICSNLWRSVVVNSDGSIAPCCSLYDKSSDFGNILDTNFKDIWNNELYISARKLFARRFHANAKKKNTACNVCRVFKHT